MTAAQVHSLTGPGPRRKEVLDILLATALMSALVLSVLDGLALTRWSDRLRRLESNQQIDGRILRWYAEGFAQPCRRARLLAWTTGILLLVCTATQSPLWLSVGSAMVCLLAWTEWHWGRSEMRQHLRFALHRATLSTPPRSPG